MNEQYVITTELVRALILQQFPQWADLEVMPLLPGGVDNRTYRLGNTMSVRLPSGSIYEPQAIKEHRILPYLHAHLSMPISCPIALGEPCDLFPHPWSVYSWIEGKTLLEAPETDPVTLAGDIGSFLRQLQSLDASMGPAGGKHNCYRGCHISVWDDDQEEKIRAVLELNKSEFEPELMREIWQKARKTHWERAWDRTGVWVHGDIAPGNILVKDHHLAAVIDFGCAAVGDPACDYSIAWDEFELPARKKLLESSGVDPETWLRGACWAMWHSLLDYQIGYWDHLPDLMALGLRRCRAVLEDYTSGTLKGI